MDEKNAAAWLKTVQGVTQSNVEIVDEFKNRSNNTRKK